MREECIGLKIIFYRCVYEFIQIEGLFLIIITLRVVSGIILDLVETFEKFFTLFSNFS